MQWVGVGLQNSRGWPAASPNSLRGRSPTVFALLSLKLPAWRLPFLRLSTYFPLKLDMLGPQGPFIRSNVNCPRSLRRSQVPNCSSPRTTPLPNCGGPVLTVPETPARLTSNFSAMGTGGSEGLSLTSQPSKAA
jgi:hypothetical protein